MTVNKKLIKHEKRQLSEIRKFMKNKGVNLLMEMIKQLKKQKVKMSFKRLTILSRLLLRRVNIKRCLKRERKPLHIKTINKLLSKKRMRKKFKKIQTSINKHKD